MKRTCFRIKAFSLLEELEQNNTKEWYAEHKSEFTEELLAPFETLLLDASEKLKGSPLPLQGSKKTMFRQHRDVRFSTDKSPYKTHVAGLLTPDGTKNESQGLAYVHLSSDGGFLACGRYKLDNRELTPIRERILRSRDEFASVLSSLERTGLSFLEDGMLKSMPRGFEDAKEDPMAYYLKLKGFCVKRKLTKKNWREGDILDEIVELANQCRGLIEFIKQEDS